MRWFLDTEFNENGKTIELISIGLINEPGTVSYYAVSSGFNVEDCNPWVTENVLPFIDIKACRPRALIRQEIQHLLLDDADYAVAGNKPEIWGYFADYDWVALCQLFGRMVDLPKGMPMYCRDLRQLMDFMHIKKDQLPVQAGNEHHALADAKWIRDGYLWMMGQSTQSYLPKKGDM